MITALFILNARGDALVSKFYKDGVKRNVLDVFRIHVITLALNVAAPGSKLPVLTLGSTSFLYIRLDSLWLVAVTRLNQNALLIFEFLFNFDALLRRLFARLKRLTDEDVVGNFACIYDILSEAVDFGYPISLDLPYLASVIPSIAAIKIAPEAADDRAKRDAEMLRAVDHAYDPGAISWREPGIKYRKNEIYLDVVEKITVLLDGKGHRLRSSIDGTIGMKLLLSGMPVCRFGFADDNHLALNDFKFHQCVDLPKFDSERVVRFVPPDGTFQLMGYHISDDFALPFEILPEVTTSAGSTQLKVRLRPTFAAKSAASDVCLRIVVPQGTTKNDLSSLGGKARFDVEESVIFWRFLKIYGQLDHILTADVGVPVAGAGLFRPKLALDFTLKLHSALGLQVKFLKVTEKTNYKTVKWVNYKTVAGSYEIRL